MAVAAFTDGRVYVGSLDLSGQSNSVSLDLSAAELDASTVKDAWDVAVLGRKTAMLDVQGFWAAGTGYPDDLFNLLGTRNVVQTVAPDGSDGSVAYSYQGMVPKYSLGAPAGELIKFTAGGKLDVSRAIRGTVLHDDTATRSSTGNGTGRQLGAVGATQSVYGALHLVGATGTATLQAIVQSDDNSGFTSATDRITFSTSTAATPTSQWSSAAGAITDDYWRVRYVIGGTGTVTFVCVVGIC